MSSSVAREDSPSAERRKALKQADTAYQLRVLESCPLSKYITIADRLLQHFQDALDGRRLDESYVFGLRFANLCISGLPQHPDWKRDASIAKARKRLTEQVGDVLSKMDVIKQRMDAEELLKLKEEMLARQRKEALQREEEKRAQQRLEDEKRREQQQRDALEEERAQFLAEQRSQREIELQEKLALESTQKKETQKKDVEQSAMAKLKAMQAKMSSPLPVAKTAAPATKTNGDPPTTVQRKSSKDGKKAKNLFLVAKKKTSDPPTSEATSTTKNIGAKNQVSSTAVVKESANTEEAHRSRDVEEKPKNKKVVEPTIATIPSLPKAEKIVESSSDTVSTTNIVKSEEHGTPAISSSSKKTTSASSTKSSGSIKSKILSSIGTVKSNTNKVSSTIANALSTPGIKSSDTQSPASNKENLRLPSEEMIITTSDTTAHIIAAQQAPRSRKEQATIDKLQRAIAVQEDRLEDIEGKQIPFLLDAAKSCLRENNQKEALKCLAHKKRLERQVDTVKAAVFNMETQMFMLESAFEDRHVKKALAEATSAIAGFQQSIGDPKAAMVDLTNMPELEVGDDTDEELMEELNEWLSPGDRKKALEAAAAAANDDDLSVLSMPAFLPAAPVATPTKEVDRMINAVITE